MILAAPDFLVWTIVIIVWAVSTYLDHKRKKKQLEERKRAQEAARAREEERARGVERARDNQQAPSEPTLIERAEAESQVARTEASAGNKVGAERVTEKTPEEILREILLGSEHTTDEDADRDYDDAESYDSQTPPDRWREHDELNQGASVLPDRTPHLERLRPHFAARPQERLKVMEDLNTQPSDRRLSRARSLLSSRDQLRNAILAAEVLGRPKSKQRHRSR